MAPFRISAHALSYSILMAPALVYTVYSYRSGVGHDNTELEEKLVSGKRGLAFKLFPELTQVYNVTTNNTHPYIYTFAALPVPQAACRPSNLGRPFRDGGSAEADALVGPARSGRAPRRPRGGEGEQEARKAQQDTARRAGGGEEKEGGEGAGPEEKTKKVKKR